MFDGRVKALLVNSSISSLGPGSGPNYSSGMARVRGSGVCCVHLQIESHSQEPSSRTIEEMFSID